jgi:putative ABC transport system permease protein
MRHARVQRALPRTLRGILGAIAFAAALLGAATQRALAHGGESLPAPGALSDVLVTDRTARALGLSVGDTLEVAPDASMREAAPLRIAGIYRPRPDPFEVGYGRLHLAMHLTDLAALTGAEDRADRIVVRLRDPAGRQAFAADFNRAAYGMRAYTSEDLARRSSSTFVVISQFHKAIGVVSLLAGLVFLVAIMMLKVEEMRRELGALRLLGISRRTVVQSVLAIAAAVAFFGSLLGVGLGLLAIAVINPLAQARYDTDLVFARATPAVVALAVGLSVCMGVVAGVAVAARLVRARALDQVGR